MKGIIHGNSVDVNWIRLNKETIYNHYRGTTYTLIEPTAGKKRWQVEIQRAQAAGPMLIYLRVQDTQSARDAFERIAEQLGAVDLLAEEAGPLPSIHDACDRCSTQSSAAHLESVWLCEVCQGVTIADKEIIGYLRRYIKKLKAALRPFVKLLERAEAEEDGKVTTEIDIYHLRIARDALEGQGQPTTRERADNLKQRVLHLTKLINDIQYAATWVFSDLEFDGKTHYKIQCDLIGDLRATLAGAEGVGDDS